MTGASVDRPTALPPYRPPARLTVFNRRLVTVETFLAATLVIAIFVIVLLQVLLRYLFAYPSPWSEEVSRFCFVWLSMLGASLAIEHRSHFAFDLVLGRLPAGLRSLVTTTATGLIAVIAALLVLTGFALVRLAIGQRSPALDLPMAWVYASVPVSGMLMLVHLAGRRADGRVDRRAGGQAGGGGQGEPIVPPTGPGERP